MFYAGLQLVNHETELSFHVCHQSKCGKYFAVADMNKALRVANPSKPQVLTKEELVRWVTKFQLEKMDYELPAEMTFSDDTLRKQKKGAWIKKRDIKWANISPLCHEGAIETYLYGDGVGGLIEELLTITDDWNTRGVFYNALNRYITFGCTKLALLPFKYKNLGSNYRHVEKPGASNVKRGRKQGKRLYSMTGTATKSHHQEELDKELKQGASVEGTTRGITLQDKKNIERVVRKMPGKFTIQRAYELYHDTYERVEISREINGEMHFSHVVHQIEERISYQQFKYHLKKIIGPERLLKKRVGQLRYDKDYKAKQGSSLDGVLGATHRYEVDATVLDLYVRYPFCKSGRLTMGRPILYIVVDVFSTMIVGMYLGFEGPNWTGVSQALVNACTDKVQFAARYGEVISPDEWPARHIPSQLTIDNGSEYPGALIKTILKTELGISAFNFTAIHRGDSKGTVEGMFNVLNNEFVHHEPGAIFKNTDRGEQHPSNSSLYTYEEVVKKLIRQIIYHNNSANRLKKFNWQAVYDDIEVTPRSLFLHSLETEMDGGRPTDNKDICRINWGFLAEEEATVQKDGLRFRGLMYVSADAARLGFFDKANFDGRYKITVKRTHQDCTYLWHKTPDGKFIRFELKQVNDESPFLGLPWEMADHTVYYQKQKHYDAAEIKLHQKAKRDAEFKRIEREAQKDVQGIPVSGNKSIQADIKTRQAHQKEINQQREAENFQKSINSAEHNAMEAFGDDLIDLDDEFFG